MSGISNFKVGETIYGINAQALDTPAEIDGVAFDGSGSVSRYAVCSTAAATAAKTASLGTALTLTAGAIVCVNFVYGNTAASPTLNVGDTGAAAILYKNGTSAGSGAWSDGETLAFVYNGTGWVIENGGIIVALQGKQDILSFDNEPQQGSTNPVTSDGIFETYKDAIPYALGAYPYVSVSGATVEFDDGADGIPLKTLLVNIVPVQAEGTPAPDNVLDVSGWAGANIVVSPTDDPQDGTVYAVDWTDEAGTVYGGILNAVTGVLTITRTKVLFSSLTWNAQGNDVYRASFSSNEYYDTTTAPGVLCSAFRPVTRYNFLNYEPNNALCVYKPGSTNYLYVRASGFDDDAAAFKATYGSVYVISELIDSAYTSVQLTPAEVVSLLGENYISADCGDITVDYRADPMLYINGKIAALTALMSET